MVARRARELGIDAIVQGADSKAEALEGLIAAGFPDSDLAAVGDDLQDLTLFNHATVVFSITVPNAHPVVVSKADFVTQRSGGEGVVVEIAQETLKALGSWPY